MDITEAQKLDFSIIDIDKYLSWLKTEYSLLAQARYLPFYNDILNEFYLRKFRVETHYLLTRGKELPSKIATLYVNRIAHFDRLIKKLEDTPVKLIYFNSVTGKKPIKGSKYVFFTSEQLEKVEIDITILNKWYKEYNETWKPEFISDLDKDFKRFPLPKNIYYSQKINDLKGQDFKYLPRILEGNFIYNLNEFKECFEFFIEVNTIWQIHYLETELLKLSSPSNTSNHSTALTLKPSFNNAEISVLAKDLSPLFDGTIEQWLNLLSDNITPPVSIKLNPKTTHRELAFLFSELSKNEFINTDQWADILDKSKAFTKSGEYLTAKQYHKAKEGLKTFKYKPNSPIIEALIIRLTETLPDKIK
tara:strand:+ start:1077 stop:2162 length:1086 start_codon:yes stop_codon:yes gene_type:complete